ncbi:MAG: hypothetical protein WHW07_00805 [Bacteroidales bacterium]|jgi:hypothetical protein|nr:hypothetical protein [Bacteroidales bacterium]HOL98679.1 hypothetical protein [Bacteroidales bacterium]HOM37140.1 hypothetical protein [Bacteroidales bacterium]HPD25024.1 hypothetical protein [Bacteroidales bacterium]HRT00236.1 hypothetical protein [Bacteroidales bacterium]
MKKFALLSLIISITLISCDILNRNVCKNYLSDDKYIRCYAEAKSSNPQLAAEKSLFLAKQNASKLIDDYILEKYNHKLFLEDPDYETKITIARKTILSDINIVCNRDKYRKGLHYNYVAIEISKNEIEHEVEKRLKEKIR